MSETTQALADVGVVGMAVMGSNLARNLARHEHRVAVFNRSPEKTRALVAEHGDEGSFVPSKSVEDFVASLARPRRIILMVQAGAGTDAAIASLVPHLEAGDIIVDGGNSHFSDTRRREQELRAHDLHFVGTGISGGEVGALEGPAIMPGGAPEAYAALGPILESIAARASDGTPCCAYLGPDGAGHFVKMVHNGIEYADMQFIGEAYTVLRASGLTPAQAADVFDGWRGGILDSYLVDITVEVLRAVDSHTGQALVDVIVDAAGMKGTGTWTVQAALDLGVAVPTVAEAVFARAVSSQAELRAGLRGVLSGPADISALAGLGTAQVVADLEQALWAGKIVAYAEGFHLIATASAEYGWDVDLAEVASIWRAGCIIRAGILDRIRSEFAGADLVGLLAAPDIARDLAAAQEPWRRIVVTALTDGVPVPGLAASLTSYDQLRATRLNAALTQGLRDYFGAHSYRRVDRPGSYHTLWSTTGDEVRVDT